MTDDTAKFASENLWRALFFFLLSFCPFLLILFRSYSAFILLFLSPFLFNYDFRQCFSQHSYLNFVLL